MTGKELVAALIDLDWLDRELEVVADGTHVVEVNVVQYGARRFLRLETGRWS
jgi:hypothetical protein